MPSVEGGAAEGFSGAHPDNSSGTVAQPRLPGQVVEALCWIKGAAGVHGNRYPEFRYLGTEITDRKLVYDQESRYLGTEITGNLQNIDFPRGYRNSYYTGHVLT